MLFDYLEDILLVAKEKVLATPHTKTSCFKTWLTELGLYLLLFCLRLGKYWTSC